MPVCVERPPGRGGIAEHETAAHRGRRAQLVGYDTWLQHPFERRVADGVGVEKVEVLVHSHRQSAGASVDQCARQQPPDDFHTAQQRLGLDGVKFHDEAEVVVWSLGAWCETVAILNADAQGSACFCQFLVVLEHQHARTYRHGHVYWRKTESPPRRCPPLPCPPGDYACEAAHGGYDKCRQFAAEAFAPGRAVVEHEVGGAVKHFPYCRTSHRCGYDVVGRRVFTFHKHFPHCTAADGKQFGLPEVEAVGASGIVKQRPVVRVRKHVGAEVVVVPLKPMLEVLLYGVE